MSVVLIMLHVHIYTFRKSNRNEEKISGILNLNKYLIKSTNGNFLIITQLIDNAVSKNIAQRYLKKLRAPKNIQS